MNETIAFLGLGSMGRGMAGRLSAAGYRLRVWNRTAGREDPAWKAAAARTPAEAARGAAVVVTMLADDDALRSVVLGKDGTLEGMDRATVHLSCSTVSPALTRELAARHAERGIGFLATPVFGRPAAAAAGKLWVLCGGDAALRERCEPVFAAMGQGTFALDRPEQAALVKLAGTFLISVLIDALGEAFALGEKGGIAPDHLLSILTGTFFGMPIVRNYGGLLARGEFEPPGFTLKLGLKDVELVLGAGTELRVPLPLASAVREHMLEGVAQGRGEHDWSAVGAVIREAAGLGRPGR